MTKKLALFVAAVAFLGVLAVACAQTPVVVYIVVTATPGSTGVAQNVPTEAAATDAASATVQPSATQTVSAEPTNTVRQIYVAEQPFQRGRMFWLEPTGQIWVIVETSPGIGVWQVYSDEFKEGDPESDPALIAPTGLLQPIRGFGLIWRSGQNVREDIGWATDIEVGFVTNYEYVPGPGSTLDNPQPGYHFMQNQYGDWYRFNEINGTWQSVQRAIPTATPTGDATE